jgi:hypothetical protein
MEPFDATTISFPPHPDWFRRANSVNETMPGVALPIEGSAAHAVQAVFETKGP